MVVKINLLQHQFSEAKETIIENATLSATTFKYSTGIEAVTLQNSKGYVTLLP